MMTRSHVCFLVVFFCMESLLLDVSGMSIKEMIETDKRFVETQKFADASGVLQDIEENQFGSVAMIIPNNDAWKKISEARRSYLLNAANKEDIETLLLFGTTDVPYTQGEVMRGIPPVVSLLGAESELKDDKVCVLSMRDGSAYDCANIVEWDVTADDGVVHIIDKVLYPEELLFDSNFPSE